MIISSPDIYWCCCHIMFPENIMSWINRWNLVKVWHWCKHTISANSWSTRFFSGRASSRFSFNYLELEKRMLLKLWKQIQRASMTWGLVILHLSIADDHVTACFKFVCSLYDKSHKDYNINYLWYKFFTQKTLPEKNYHQHLIPYYSTFSEQIINV